MLDRRSIVLLPVLAGAVQAGDLTPPAGAPASTMKTLQQVEPRWPINAQTTPGDADSVFKITQPGSYYLDADLHVTTDEHGIEVVASNVTIDLNGFTVSSAGNGQRAGVAATTLGLTNVEVRNGVIRGFGGAGVDFNEFTGEVNVAGGSARHLRVSHCGAGVNAGSPFTIADCEIGSVTNGVAAWGGVTIERSHIFDASGYGVLSVNNSTIIRDTSIRQIGLTGVLMSSGAVERVHIRDISGDGISCGSATVRHCDIEMVVSNGIFAGSEALIEQNRVAQCMGTGIRVNGGSRVANNQVFGFSAAQPGVQVGIAAPGGTTTIDSNSIQNVDSGIVVSGNRSLIVRNSITGVQTSINSTGAHTVGPIVLTSGSISTTNPWANFLMNY